MCAPNGSAAIIPVYRPVATANCYKWRRQ